MTDRFDVIAHPLTGVAPDKVRPVVLADRSVAHVLTEPLAPAEAAGLAVRDGGRLTVHLCGPLADLVYNGTMHLLHRYCRSRAVLAPAGLTGVACAAVGAVPAAQTLDPGGEVVLRVTGVYVPAEDEYDRMDANRLAAARGWTADTMAVLFARYVLDRGEQADWAEFLHAQARAEDAADPADL